MSYKALIEALEATPTGVSFEYAAYRSYGFSEAKAEAAKIASLADDQIAALEREVEAYKVAARQLKGIPASVGVPEPIEGFAARPQDIMPAVLDMALRIEGLEKQLTALGKVQELASKLVSIANQETECYAILTVDVDALKEALAAGEAG